MTIDVNTKSEAIDAPVARRPGNPMERAPEPIANAHWLVPDKQRPHGEVLKGVERQELSATFGTEQPPRALSGVLRRRAYTIPDYRVKHWMLLILADRVEGVEARLLAAARHPATWLLAAGVAGAWIRLRRGRSRSLFALR